MSQSLVRTCDLCEKIIDGRFFQVRTHQTEVFDFHFACAMEFDAGQRAMIRIFCGRMVSSVLNDDGLTDIPLDNDNDMRSAIIKFVELPDDGHFKNWDVHNE